MSGVVVRGGERVEVAGKAGGSRSVRGGPENAQGQSVPKQLKFVVHIPEPEVAQPVQNSTTGTAEATGSLAPRLSTRRESGRGV